MKWQTRFPQRRHVSCDFRKPVLGEKWAYFCYTREPSCSRRNPRIDLKQSRRALRSCQPCSFSCQQVKPVVIWRSVSIRTEAQVCGIGFRFCLVFLSRFILPSPAGKTSKHAGSLKVSECRMFRTMPPQSIAGAKHINTHCTNIKLECPHFLLGQHGFLGY